MGIPPVHHRVQFAIANPPAGMFLDIGRKSENLEEKIVHKRNINKIMRCDGAPGASSAPGSLVKS